MGTLKFINNNSTYNIAPCVKNTVSSSPLLHVLTKSAEAPDIYGFTSNTSASLYSPAFNVNGNVCYLGRTESYTSSRSSQYTSGYATRSSISGYGTASRASTSGYATRSSISGYGTASRASTSGYATRSSISGYGTASRKSTWTTSYAAQIGNVESDMFCDFNRGGLNKYSFYGGGCYTQTALMAGKVNKVSITASFSNTAVSPWKKTLSSSEMVSNVVSSMSTAFGNGDNDYFYMSVIPKYGIIFCDLNAREGFKVTAAATRYLSDVYLTRSSQYTSATLTRASTSATLTRSSQYTTATLTRASTSATLTRSSQYTSATLTRASTSATLTASRSSQYNTTSCNINI